ncbi:MAG: hypothetical protein HUK26_04050, partial [Duodenibacillus sp.]|nr:hypothetical protein [Duodenibacillus sp.]
MIRDNTAAAAQRPFSDVLFIVLPLWGFLLLAFAGMQGLDLWLQRPFYA